MSLIVGEGISKTWSARDVLKNVSFTLAPGQRVAMVGPNGQGKSTLLKIIAGVDAPTWGKLSRKAGLAVGYLAQDPPDLGDITLEQAMNDVFAPLRRMEHEMHELATRLEHGAAGDPSAAAMLARYGQLQHDFEQAGGYTYARAIARTLEGLELPRDLWNRPLSHLSGGQRSRAHLGRLLLEQPDVLLLDEPTNHLDMDSLEWLETYLSNFGGAMIVVSHDRYFLDRVTNYTWEVAFATVECYKGSYSRYLPQQAERFNERMKRWEAQQQYIEETQEFIRRFIAGQRTKEAQGRRTRLERFMRDEAIAKPQQNQAITIRLRATQRSGDFVMHLNDLAVGYAAKTGENRLIQIDKLDVRRGERVAIVGPNGCGKTTLLKTMLGQLPPLSGAVRLGANVQVGYLSQRHTELDEDMTAMDCVRSLDTSVTEQRARSLLGQVGLSGDESLKKVCELSGGQRSRILLARLMLASPNVLILDEPTNHLDIPSQEVLQAVLSDFGGTIIFVSHDRYLIQAMATSIWAVESGSVKVLSGSWDAYLNWRGRTLEAAPAADNDDKQRAKQARAQQHQDRRRQTNETRQMRRRLGQVEHDIHKFEQTLKNLDAQLLGASEAGNLDLITQIGIEHGETQHKITALMQEWEQLSLALDEEG